MGISDKLAAQASTKLGEPVVAAAMIVPPGAGTVPTAQGVLALTADRAVYLKKKKLGVGVGEPVTEWPRNSVTFAYEDNGKWSYPGLVIGLADGSSCVVFGEKKWGLDGIASAP